MEMAADESNSFHSAEWLNETRTGLIASGVARP